MTAHKEETLSTFTNMELGEMEIHEAPLRLLAADLKTNVQTGLTSAAAAKKLEEDGPNELEQPPKISLFMLFIIQLTQFIIGLLLVACICSAAINATDSSRRGNPLSYVDSIAIFIIVVLNAAIAASTENAANSALSALSSLSSPISTVIRDGQEMEVPSKNLVVGDVVALNTGDVVPADARLIQAADLKVNEMLLTGESEDVSKSDKVKKKPKGAPEKLTADTMIFSSCTVKAGNAKALVVRTGMQTRVGQIAALLSGEKKQKKSCLPESGGQQTPLQVELGKLGLKIGMLAIACCTFVFIVGIGIGVKDPEKRTAGWLYMILISVTLTVAAIPEGLPLCVTISLSTGCSQMVSQHVLMRKIAAVETLGSCAIICTDKTGTLTEGKMTCVKMWAANQDFVVTGRGFDPTVGSVGRKGAKAADEATGKFAPEDDRSADETVRATLMSALLCSSTTLSLEDQEDGSKRWTPKGNSSEAPLVVLAAKLGMWAKDLSPANPRATEIPFSSSRKMMIIVTKTADASGASATAQAAGMTAPHVAHIKGAPNYILDACTQMVSSAGTLEPFTAQRKKEVLDKVDELSSQALRVLAIAVRPLESELPYGEEAEIEEKFDVLVKDITLLGLVASIDPERSGVRAAVEEARNASVRTVMITGDYLKTAQAIAKNISILPPDGSLDKNGSVDCNSLRPGGEYLKDDEMDELTGRVNVFARAKPEDKLEIVKSLQRQEFVCAMTGDGVNDAPALKEADIGVSMGLEGTEVAKGASDMILTDDNFCSIVRAVEKGRVIYAGIQKFVSFIMSVHFAEVLQIFLCIVIGIPIMRQPLQILFLVLVTDLPPAIALGVEPAEGGIMNKKPRPKAEPVVLPWMWRCIVANGMVMTCCILAVYLVCLDAYAGKFFQEDIVDNSRVQCTVWRKSAMFSSVQYEDGEDDDKFKDCTKFAIRKARTTAFIALVWAENLRAYTARSFTKPVWHKPFSNMAMNKAVLMAQLALYLGLFVPGLNEAVLGLYVYEINWWGWVLALVGALACAVGCEIYKCVAYQFEARRDLPDEPNI